MNTRTNRILAGTVLTLVLSTVAGTAQASMVYYDGVFNDSDWSLTVVTNTTGTGSTAQGFQVPTGGNPDEYREIRHQLLVTPPGNGFLFSFHLNNNAFYTPSTQGPISYIDYSEDSINFVPDTIVPGNGQGSGLLILQNGNFYRQQNPILVMPYSGYSTWTANPAPGLLAADFAEVTLAGVIIPSSNPDFSATGSIMQLGFHRGNSGNGNYETDCGIDNWRVNIVPEPASAALLALGGLFGFRRRRG